MRNKKRHLQVHKLNILDYMLLFGVAVSTVMVLVILYSYTNSVKQSRIDLIYEVMEQNANNQQSQLDEFIDEKVHVLQALASYRDIYEMDPEAQHNVVRGKANDLGFKHLFVMDLKGYGYYFAEGAVRDQSNEQFYRDVIGNEIFVTKPFYADGHTVIMTVSVSIYNENGMKCGALCGAVNLKSVQSLIAENEMILDGKAYILDKEGCYVVSENYDDVYYMRSIYRVHDSDLTLLDAALKDKEDKYGRVCLDGVYYQAHASYLDSYDWVILQLVSEEVITERFVVLDQVQYALSILIIVLIVCMVRIIYRWRKSDKKIYTDALTKCRSRAACVDLIDVLEKRRREQIAIVYMDLNRFKWVNDTYGHDKGDELLKMFGEILNKSYGKEGFVGRMGGDEFVAILLNATEKKVLELWQKVEELLEEYSSKLDYEYRMSSSYGYAIRQKGERISVHDLLQEADKKMYEYKVEQKRKEKEQSGN